MYRQARIEWAGKAGRTTSAKKAAAVRINAKKGRESHKAQADAKKKFTTVNPWDINPKDE